MGDPVITNVDLGNGELANAVFRDELLNFAGADTFKAGTILARRRVATAVTASAVTGTGDGTVTLATVVAGAVPLVGAYVLTCVLATANGGTWKLVDPNGQVVADNLIMTAGAGAATVFKAGGLQFTITDGAADFVAGDTATLTVAADGKLVPYAIAGVGGAQHPIAVLTYDVTRGSAGNEKIQAMVGGSYAKERLIIDADGDGSNLTDEILDALRAAGVYVKDVQQLAKLDNQ